MFKNDDCVCETGILSDNGTECCAKGCNSCTSASVCTACANNFSVNSKGKCECQGPVLAGVCNPCDAG